MAKPKRRGHALSKKQAVTPEAAPAAPRSPQPKSAVAPNSSLWRWLVPNLLVVGVAVAAVYLEFTTHPSFVQSKTLQRVLKRAFAASVCLTARVQLADFVNPPRVARQPPSLRRLLLRHARGLFVAVAANSAGTTIIHPLFGSSPQYEETVRLVVPVYVAVELVVDGLHVPTVALRAVVGLCVSWLKAMTIARLVLQWQTSADAHPLAFVAISTANLYASGVVLRFLAHYTRSQRVLGLSTSVCWWLLQIAATAATMGFVAHTANHLAEQPERYTEAKALYLCVAWFALNKYWKAPLGELLFSPASAKVASKTD